MKLLTALILLLSLVLPAGMVSQAVAGPVQGFCTVVDESGSACCNPAEVHCCCDVSPGEPAPQPLQPLPASSAAAKDIAASLPNLLVLEELPRLSASPAKSAFFSDRAPFVTAPPVRLCVLRCSLLL